MPKGCKGYTSTPQKIKGLYWDEGARGGRDSQRWDVANRLFKSGGDWLGLVGLLFVALLILLTISLLMRAVVSY
jgi:hypothetical protein